MGAWTWSAAAMVLDAKRKGSANTSINGRRPTNVPSHTLKLGAQWRAAGEQRLTLGGALVHEGRRTSDLRTPYWDWTPRADGTEFWQYWNGTAPTHHLFGLRESLTMLLDEEGLPAVWARHEVLAQAVWAAFDAWGTGHPAIALNVADPVHRGRS